MYVKTKGSKEKNKIIHEVATTCCCRMGYIEAHRIQQRISANDKGMKSSQDIVHVTRV